MSSSRSAATASCWRPCTAFCRSGVPIYGMHRGSVGFLMNAYRPDGLLERLATAQPVVLHPLEMIARDDDGGSHRALAINEVSLLRESRQAAKLRDHASTASCASTS